MTENITSRSNVRVVVFNLFFVAFWNLGPALGSLNFVFFVCPSVHLSITPFCQDWFITSEFMHEARAQ